MAVEYHYMNCFLRILGEPYSMYDTGVTYSLFDLTCNSPI